MEQGRYGVGPVQTDTEDYTQDVSAIIEQGTAYNGILPSFTEWRKDAYLMYSKPSVSLEEIMGMTRTDGMARALMLLLTLPIKTALTKGRWVAPPEGGADEEVEFANLMWTLPPEQGGMTTPFNRVVDQILLSIAYGFSVFELVTDIATSGPLKGKRYLRKIAYRDPRTITLLQDKQGGYAGFRQRAALPGGGLVDYTLSPARSVLFTVGGAENPLYGTSMLLPAYTHYTSKLRWYYMSEMSGQMSAIPGRVGTVPRSAKAADAVAFRNALEGMYFNATVLKKEGYELEPFASNTVFPFLSYIDHHNLMMAKSTLSSFMESEQRTVLVENTTQDASADLFLLSMQTLADDIATTITQHIMPKYIQQNFKDPKYPVFVPGPLSNDQSRRINTLFEKLAISGILNTTPELVRALEVMTADELGLDIDYAEIEQREEEAAIQQAEQAELLAAQAQQQSIEEERAAAGGVAGAPLAQSEIDSNQAPQVDVAASNVTKRSEVDKYVNAAHSLMLGNRDNPFAVDEGFESWYHDYNNID